MKSIIAFAILVSSIAYAGDRLATMKVKSKFCQAVKVLNDKENQDPRRTKLGFNVSLCKLAPIMAMDPSGTVMGIHGPVPFTLQGIPLSYYCDADLENDVSIERLSCTF